METISIEELIREVGGSLYRGEGAYFVGAGISAGSGLPDWLGLITRLASSLGITVTSEDDLPAIAQYCVNAELGNRGTIIGRLRRHLSVKKTKFNRYHDAIVKTNISTIWTTNYDMLFEKAFPPERLAVRANDFDLTSGVKDFDIELLKVHGCINRSAPHEFVLTKEDYEDFEVRRPAMGRRLRHDLLNRTILFIGYGNRDPNITTAAVEARRLSGNASKEHFFISKPPLRPNYESDQKHGEAYTRHLLWLADLRRYGIKTALIESFKELENALYAISLVSRGRSVYVTGGHESSASNLKIAFELGSKLAEIPAVVLLNGQSEGVGRQASMGFGEACISSHIDLRDHVRYFPNPYAFNPNFANDRAYLKTLKEWRASLFRAAHVVVALDGRMGTKAELEVAREMACRIIPAPFTQEGPVYEFLNEPGLEDLVSKSYITKAKKGKLTVNDIISCVRSVLEP